MVIRPLRALTSSVSFGTTSCTSPTTPRSENSKIGAFGSLLIATITFELCIPTLCWIAPEMPQAMYSFGDTVFPVWPTCVAYGYQPASTTARVAPTAPPNAFASSSTSVKFSGPPSPRPPATITGASSIDGPSLSSCAWSTIRADVGEVFERDRCILHFRRAAGGVRVERARAEERDPRLGLPADVHEDGVLQGGTLADELAVLLHEVAEVPVQAGVEPGGKSRRDIRGEHGVAEEHGVDALVADQLREHVDPRLRQRRLELRVVGDVDLRGAELARFVGEAAHARADDDTGDFTVAERRRLREHAERPLQQLVAVMLEKDERAHTRRFSARKSRIACAALPSSSIFFESARAGGSFNA